MPEHSPIDPQVIFRMRETIRLAIAQRSASINEAAAEARGLGRGLAPALPASVIDEVVVSILRELGAYQPPAAPLEHRGQELRHVTWEEVADSLSYAMRFNEQGRARKTGYEHAVAAGV
ncbi:hypothetical protein DFH01_25060 [Falsiroseomonas bella]|uniref:Uncharacterized protein n=1 Tax=Falsiroseomonas bella TaxID=2184016 RepID=A0A317F8L8_9PROT|nr:hypothetical protein [Falsiroseomonas bella]PWS34299.1 hypothetical protein DFH01_25060 [Falsiroseomonas bella]